MDDEDPRQETPLAGAAHHAGTGQLDASVIIPVRQSVDLIRDCLDAIGPQILRGRHELIVVDDASTDGTADTIEDWSASHPDVPLALLVAPERGGPNASRNAGVLASTGRLLAFTDGDDMVREGWLEAMLGASDGRSFLAGAVEDLATGALDTRPLRVGSITYAQGNAMAVPRDLVVELDGFDPRILRGGSEVEFAHRLRARHDISPTPVPAAVTRYRQPTTSSGRARRIVQRQRGHVILAALHPDAVRDPSPYRSILESIRLIGEDLRALTRQRGAGRSRRVNRIARSVSSIVWIARFSVGGMPDRTPLADSLAGYRVRVDRR